MVGTSPEMGMVRLAAPSPAEARPRFRVWVVRGGGPGRGGGGPGSNGGGPGRRGGGGGLEEENNMGRMKKGVQCYP
jgi:hypothetical protein